LHIDALNHSVSIIEIDPNLRPEFSHSFSASADYYHSFGRLQTNFLVEGFYTMLDDVFTLENTGEKYDEEGNHFIYKTRRNAAGARIGGITAEVKLGIPNTFDVQLGYTFQKSLYVEPEQWSEDVEAQRTMFRSPDHYGYLNAKYFITKDFNASLFGTFTGPMLVQHSAHTDFEEEHPDSEIRTQSFWDFGFKLSYTFSLSNVVNLEVNAGMKNIFDSYQRDIDLGAGRDLAYIYGPAMPRTYFFGVKLFL
jgi:outer membrane receptor for ferrienterochelin and colicins